MEKFERYNPDSLKSTFITCLKNRHVVFLSSEFPLPDKIYTFKPGQFLNKPEE